MHQLVGRDAELALLSGAAERAHAGHGSAITISADPGAGKTALADAFASAQQDFEVLRCRGVESEVELPFSGLHTLLRPVLHASASLPIEQQDALKSALAMRTTTPASPVVVALATLDLLAEAAATSPVLLVVDDLHWIDAATLSVLMFIARRLEHDRILLVATLRTGTDTEQLGGTELGVTPLSLDAARDLAERQLGSPLSQPISQALWRATGGNPLAVIETVRLAGQDVHTLGTILDEPIAAGARIDRGFSRRLEQLGPDTRRALVLVAVALTDATDEIAAGLRDLGLCPQALDEAERAELITSRMGKVQFVHPLLRSAVHHSASLAERQRCHAAMAAGSVSRGAKAWHAASAAVAEDEQVAQELEAVASDFERRGGRVAAARALERAAELSPSRADRARRLLAAGTAARHATRTAWAKRLLDHAHALADDPLLRLTVELDRLLLDAHTQSNAGALARQVALARAADGVDAGLAAACWIDVASEATLAGNMPMALEAVDRLRTESGARTPGRQSGADILIGVTEVLSGRSPLCGAQTLRRAVDERLETYDSFTGSLIEGLVWIEEFDLARQLIDAGLEPSRSRGAVLHHLTYLWGDGYHRFRTGDWDGARLQLSQAIRLAEDGAHHFCLGIFSAQLAIVLAAQGDPASVELTATASRLETEFELTSLPPYLENARGLYHLSCGAPELAIEHLENAEDWCIRAGYDEPSVWSSPADLVDAYLAAGRRRDAEVALERLRERATRADRTWALASVARLEGMLASDGTFDAHFARAFELFGMTRAPFDQARAQLDYGRRLQRAGRGAEARAALDGAITAFRRLGATAWLRQAEAVLAPGGLPERASALAAPDPLAELTDRERVVADCIVQGMTNKEAAAHLFLTLKTIEWHLRQIYRKLGIKSRTQLAALAHAPRTADDPL